MKKIVILSTILVFLFLGCSGQTRKVARKPNPVVKALAMELITYKQKLDKINLTSLIYINFDGTKMRFIGSDYGWANTELFPKRAFKGYLLFLNKEGSNVPINASNATSMGIMLKRRGSNKYYPSVSFKINGTIFDTMLKKVSLAKDPDNNMILMLFEGYAFKRGSNDAKPIDGMSIGYIKFRRK